MALDILIGFLALLLLLGNVLVLKGKKMFIENLWFGLNKWFISFLCATLFKAINQKLTECFLKPRPVTLPTFFHS